MQPSTIWVAAALACLISAQAITPHAQQRQLARPQPAVVQPGVRLQMVRRAEPLDELEDLTDEQKLIEQRRQIQIAQEKEEKKKKEEGLEMWREKTGKKLHAEEDRERKEKQATVDQVRERYRKDKEKMQTVAGDLSNLGELVTDEEAMDLDQKYGSHDAEHRRKELEQMILEVDSEMRQQQLWHDELEESTIKELEQETAVENLLDLEEEEKEAAMDEKMRAKKGLQEKKEKQVGLDMWQTKTGKEAHAQKEHKRREQDKTITKKRNEARSFKASQQIKLSKSEEEALRQLEEKYSQTEAAQEMQRLQQKMEETERLIEEERQRKEREMEVILQAARDRGQGSTEEELVGLEDVELKRAAMERAKVKYELEVRKGRKGGLDQYREEAGRASEEVIRDRRDRQKRLTKARSQMRESKSVMSTLEKPIEEDPYLEYLEKEDLELARLYTESQAELEWAALQDRVQKVKQQVAFDRERSAVMQMSLAQEEMMTKQQAGQVDDKEVDDKEAKARQEQEARKERLKLLDAIREEDALVDHGEDLERKQHERQLARERQLMRDAKYDALADDELLTDAELDELEMMLMDQYYARTAEAAVIADMTRKVEAIEGQLEASRRSEGKVEDVMAKSDDKEDDEDDNDRPQGPGASGPSGTTRPSTTGGMNVTFNFSAVMIPLGIMATFFAFMYGVFSGLTERQTSSNTLGRDGKPMYYSV